MEILAQVLDVSTKPLPSVTVPLRLSDCASWFDGHDAAIGVLLRLIHAWEA